MITVLNLVVTTIPARAQLIPDPNTLTNIDIAGAYTKQKELTPEEEASLKEMLTVPTQTGLETLFLWKTLYFKMNEAEKQYGEEALIKMIEKRQDSKDLDFEIKGIGKAEPIVLVGSTGKNGPITITKVRHNGLKKIMLVIDSSKIDYDALMEFDRYDRNGMLSTYPQYQGLDAKQRIITTKYNRFIIHSLRELFAKMLFNNWDPKFEYSPAKSPGTENSSTAPNVVSEEQEDTTTTKDNLEERLNEVTEGSLEDLNKEPWFAKIKNEKYDLWMHSQSTLEETAAAADLVKSKVKEWAVQGKIDSEKTDANNGVIAIFFNSQTNTVDKTIEINKKPRTSLGYWKDFWSAVWEKPSYDEDLWNRNHGFGKLKVLATGDYALGNGMTFVLTSLSIGTILASGSMPHGLSMLAFASIGASYSLFFGYFAKTTQNILKMGNTFMRTAKNWLIGISQSELYTGMSDTGFAFYNNGVFDSAAAAAQINILVNQTIKASTKTDLQEEPLAQEKVGHLQGTVKIPYFKIQSGKLFKFEGLGVATFELQNLPRAMAAMARGVNNFFSPNDMPAAELQDWSDGARNGTKLEFAYPKISLPWIDRQERDENGNGLVDKDDNPVPLVWDTKIKRNTYAFQSNQFLTTPLGILSRFGIMLGPLPLGHTLYISLGPIGKVRAIRFKESYARQRLIETQDPNHPDTERKLREAVEARNAWEVYHIPKLGNLFTTIPAEKKYYAIFRLRSTPLNYVGYVFRVPPKIVILAQNFLKWSRNTISYSMFKTELDANDADKVASPTREPAYSKAFVPATRTAPVPQGEFCEILFEHAAL